MLCLSLQSVSLFGCIMEKGNGVLGHYLHEKLPLTTGFMYAGIQNVLEIYTNDARFFTRVQTHRITLYKFMYMRLRCFKCLEWWCYAFSFYINCSDSPPKLVITECFTLSHNGDKESAISNSPLIRSQNSGIWWTVYCTD